MNRLKKKLYLYKKKLTEGNFNNYVSYVQGNAILLKYWDFENNWGDKVNPYIVEKITGKRVISSNTIFNFLGRTELLGIGSIMVGDLSNYVVWGSGIISEKTILLNKPKKVLAVRGLNSLKKIKEVGANCELFGDPVVLFPEIFPQKNIAKKYKYGVIPHFKDKNSIGIKKIVEMQNPEIKIIDIQSTGVEQFVLDVLSCENILSSSLHGLILPEAYGIPTCRVIFSEKLLGGDFKFDDYYSGVGINEKIESVLIHDNVDSIRYALTQCSLKDLNFKRKELINSLIEYTNSNDRK